MDRSLQSLKFTNFGLDILHCFLVVLVRFWQISCNQLNVWAKLFLVTSFYFLDNLFQMVEGCLPLSLKYSLSFFDIYFLFEPCKTIEKRIVSWLLNCNQIVSVLKFQFVFSLFHRDLITANSIWNHSQIRYFNKNFCTDL